MKLNPIEQTYRTQVWDAMNELDYTPQHFLNTKYTLNAVIDAIQHRDYDMVEKLSNVAMDLLDYYCDTFEKKFKVAWSVTLNTADIADGCSAIQNEQYTEEELNAMCDAAEKTSLSKTKTWTVPIEEDHFGEYYVTFPNELIEKVGWVENDVLEWIDNKDGTFSIKKVKK